MRSWLRTISTLTGVRGGVLLTSEGVGDSSSSQLLSLEEMLTIESRWSVL